MLLGLAYLARREIGHEDSLLQHGSVLDFPNLPVSELKSHLVRFCFLVY